MVETIDLMDDGDEDDDDFNDFDGMLYSAADPMAAARTTTPRNPRFHPRVVSDPAILALVGRIRTLLRTSVGVCPSDDWLADCLTELQQQPFNNTEDSVLAASVLDQILYHDLRDVVRNFATNSNDTPESLLSAAALSAALSAAAALAPQIQLRRAIRQSLTAESSFQATLPAEFRLLVQAEEFVDVSLSAEKRFSAEATTNITLSDHQRCLKIAFTDGYAAEGSRNANMEDTTALTNTNSNSNNTSAELHSFIAMEVTPLVTKNNGHHPQTLHAGAKFLLQGPITIRHGVVGWHAGNAVFLGGQVAALVEIQQQAMASARERVGHGVDPTVRALIGNQARPDENDNNADAEDEGEHASGDIVLPPQRNNPTTRMQPPPPPPAQQALQERPAVSSGSSSSSSGTNPYSSLAPFATTATNLSSSSAPSSSSTQQPRLQSPTFVTPSSTSTQLNPYRSQLSHPTTGQQQQRRTNPYSANSTTNSNTSDSSSQNKALTTSNAYAKVHASLSTAAANRHCSSTMNHNDSTLGIGIPNAASTAAANAAITGSSSSNAPAMTSMATPAASSRASAVAVVTRATSPPLPSTHYPYQQLLDLLMRAVHDVTLYRQVYGQRYTVPLQMVGNHLNFNIVKQKQVDGNSINNNSNKKKAEKHYEYVMDARFRGNSDNVAGVEDIYNTITCRMASSVMEPYFELSPSEMRKLNRSDRTRADHLVLEGGRVLRQESLRLHVYEVALEQMPDEFFSTAATTAPQLNGVQPILRLLRRRD